MRDPNDPTIKLKMGDHIIGDDGTVTCVALRDIAVDDPLDVDDFEWTRPKPGPGESIQRDWGFKSNGGIIVSARWISEAGAIAAGLD